MTPTQQFLEEVEREFDLKFARPWSDVKDVKSFLRQTILRREKEILEELKAKAFWVNSRGKAHVILLSDVERMLEDRV